jgi:eukaryotic-like serine/threonine-protein kinase
MPRDLSANSVYGPRMHPLGDAGRVIAGRYRLEAPIGRGAMGVVWRARDQLLDRDVAVKEVQIAETLTDEEKANAYQRTLREAKTAARLNHPGVVTVYDVAEDSGRPWIVMQLVAAQSLDQVLAVSGPLSPRRTAEMGRQLLSVLSVAHAAGVMHRDVKPSNVLLGADDRAVLTDFGIATFAGDPRLTQTGMVMGSPGFTAPERIRGEDATPASDLWSLGATLFAAVEGHGPFEARGGAITTMSAIINEDAPQATDAGALAPVIAALLRRAPSDRPDAVTAARMITDVLPQLPARTGPAPAGYQPTALSKAPATPGATALDRSAATDSRRSSGADQTPAGDALATPPAAGVTPVSGQPSLSQTSPTTPQPVLGGATVHDQPTAYDPRYEQPTQYDSPSRPAAPPADFSSWYDPSPRSGPSQPWSGSQPGSGSGPGSRPGSGSRAVGAAPPAARPEYRPEGRRRRRRGMWWKIALVVLALLGAAAGAATILLLRHSPTSTANGQGTTAGPGGQSASTSAAALPPASLQLVNAINMQTGSLPAGWTTLTHHASNGETAGFKIAYPASWAESTTGYQTTLKNQSGSVSLIIDLTPHTYPNDMLAEAEYIRQQSLAQGHFPGYSSLGLARTPVRGTQGAYWKFTWQDNGVQQEVIDFVFVLNGQSYALYFTAPASVWTPSHPTFDEEAETFAPLT